MLRLVINYQKRKYVIAVDVESYTVRQLKEKVMVACGVPVVQQKLLGLPSIETMRLARLKLVDGQQFLLFRRNLAASASSASETMAQSGSEGSIWEELPGEVQYLVFGHLDDYTLANCALVCRDWKAVTRDDWIWEDRTNQKWMTIGQASRPADVSWAAFYLEQSRLDRNWSRSRYKVSRYQVSATLLDFKPHGYQLMCETSEAPPQEADTEFERMQTHYQHEKIDSIIAAVSGDKRIAIGNLWTNEVLKSLEGHSSRIAAVSFAGLHHLISSDESGTLLLWDLHRSSAALPWSVTSSELVGTRRVHNRPIRALRMSQGCILVGADDGTVLVLDLNKMAHPMMMMRQAHGDDVSSLDALASSNLFVSSGREGFAKVWDMRTASPVMSIYADSEHLTQVKFGWPNQLLTAGDSGVRVWDLRNASMLGMPYKSRVAALDYDGTRIAMAGESRVSVAHLGQLSVPPIEPTDESTTAINHWNMLKQYDDLQYLKLPMAKTKRIYLTPWSVIGLSDTTVVGVDASIRVSRVRVERPSEVFERLDEYIPPPAIQRDDEDDDEDDE